MKKSQSESTLQAVYEERRQLIENHSFTLNGIPCSVGGIHRFFATLAPRTGEFYWCHWGFLKEVAEKHKGKILKSEVHYASSAWLRIGRELS